MVSIFNINLTNKCVDYKFCSNNKCTIIQYKYSKGKMHKLMLDVQLCMLTNLGMCEHMTLEECSTHECLRASVTPVPRTFLSSRTGFCISRKVQ